MPRHLLTLNAGSSSLKFALFEHDRDRDPRALLAGQVEGFGTHPRLTASSATGERVVERSWRPDETGAPNGVHAALGVVLDWLQSHAAPLAVRAVGHRVVHGGVHYAAPVLLDDAVYGRLDRLVPLAPLHQPHNLEGVRAARHHFPGTPQVACFDTGFHRGHPFVQDTFGLPRSYYEEGVRRYGFHGLSYEYIALRLAELDPRRGRGRVIVAHLGSGASMCALRDGRSVSSSMGFTALDGLPMGTRPGQLDPGVLLWLMTEKSMDAPAISELLYKHSGLKGLSGISNDMRDLRASDAPEAREAIAYFVERLRRETGALAAVLGGLDALVFTAGIGENDAALRAATADGLQFLGVRLDPAANAIHGRDTGGLVSPPDAAVAVWVIPTNEELMIARHTARLAGIETR